MYQVELLGCENVQFLGLVSGSELCSVCDNMYIFRFVYFTTIS